MSGRTWFSDQRYTSQGTVECAFSFVTNGTSDPDVTLFRGCGGLTGADASGVNGNTGPSAVASITRTGVGAYLVTFADGYRYATSRVSQIDDGADTLQARVGTISNEGAGNTAAITAAVTVRAMATGTATESTGRRISCIFLLKNSGAGT